MDFGYHMERAWQVFARFLPSVLLLTLALIGMSMITLGIMAPVCTAGYMQSLLLALREDRRPEVRDLFSQMRLFFPLLGFGILVTLVLLTSFALLVLLGLLAMVAVSFACLYLVPLMTDRNMGLFEALAESWRMAVQKPLAEQFAVVAVYVVLTSIGNSTGLGALFTQPFATLFVLSVYEVKRRRLLPEPPPPPIP
ncbi:hypothetical protein GF1_32060 [Desulfolithobacter dissulfuricans]|uniref:Uncharacterized protein n=1 Tax=Desulfolithobacter dissulfuricans TaxID=2795293 RepID=A0A915U4B8_9BACT|nr:hypothetical protein [Desulfolithobacter dissulfuricans]BCO10830.1 hypothetical protein GF1_32060 [Desulfolithobacter dissulfuricans]